MNTPGHRPAVVIGMELGNLAAMLDNRPLKVDGDELGIPFDIVIAASMTIDDIAAVFTEAGIPLPEIPPGANATPAQIGASVRRMMTKVDSWVVEHQDEIPGPADE